MKKNEKGFGVVEILLVVIIIALLGFASWMFFSRQKSITDNSDQAQLATDTKKGQQSSAPTLQPEDVIGKIKNDWASKYTLLNLDKNNHPESGELSIRLEKIAPSYKVSGFNFYTDYDGGSSLYAMPYDPNPTDYTTPKTADMALRNEIASVYKDFGLSKTETRFAKANNTDTDIYTGKGLICTVEAPTSPTSGNTASCGLIKAYEAAAEKRKPLADVIPNVNSGVELTGLKITDSPVSGYQKANMAVGALDGSGGYTVLLYKKMSDPWKYFTGTQEPPQCSAYNTTDLKNAFKGESCYGANDQMTTVR